MEPGDPHAEVRLEPRRVAEFRDADRAGCSGEDAIGPVHGAVTARLPQLAVQRVHERRAVAAALGALLAAGCAARAPSPAPATATATFTNPIVRSRAAGDPWVIRDGDAY